MTDDLPQQKNSYVAAFRSTGFFRYQLGRMIVILGAEAQALVVSWQVYSLTHRAIDLGYTGMILFLPGLVFLLPSGHIADRYDRRVVIMVCYALQLVCSGVLFWLAWRGSPPVGSIWAALFGIGMGRAFSGPASQALLPQLVEEKHFQHAVTWGGGVFQFANITGPALGGLLYALPLAHFGMARLEGAAIVYLFMLAALIFFLAMIAGIRPRPVAREKRAISAEVLLAGFAYVFRARLLLGCFSLDLFAVLLGGATALLPIYANDVLHCGPGGLGILRAAPAVGALCMTLLLARSPIRRRAGTRMFFGVALYGAAIVLFALSRNLWLSAVLLGLSGAGDMLSVIVRQSVLQLATPPEMRGRVSAVSSLFIGASNELGEFESGLTAQWWGAVRATLFGGAAAITFAGLWGFLFPVMKRINALTGEELKPLVAESMAAGREPGGAV